MARPLGFTDEKKRLFLGALERTESMTEAGREVGVLPGSVALARKSDPAFGDKLDALMAAIREGRALAAGLGPVPPKARHDGFTSKKRRRYLKTLAKTGCKADAAKAAGISTTTADRWIRKDSDFARSCAAAIDKAGSRIELLAWERAVTGIEEPVWHYGKRVGTRMKRSDGIFRMLLMASNRKKYGRMGSVGRKRLEKEERRRIEREVRAKLGAKMRVPFSVAVEMLDKQLQAMGVRLDEDRAPEPGGEGEWNGYEERWKREEEEWRSAGGPKWLAEEEARRRAAGEAEDGEEGGTPS